MSDITRLPPKRQATPAAAGIMPAPPQRQPDPRHALHPAALQAAATYSDALTRVDQQNVRIAELETALDASQRHCNMLEQRLEREVNQKETFQRYSIELRSHLTAIRSTIDSAMEAATRAAEVLPNDANRQVAQELEHGIQELARAQAHQPSDLDQRR